ncbi:hypothetical protein ACFFWC_24980 [Plantactinospora siamensis]|uniref:DUF4760 domain-containing protein n=1 Tax=Plantactinospora siamensis TaxID=555372 RepID=A0ABV6NW85_9ACTN
MEDVIAMDAGLVFNASAVAISLMALAVSTLLTVWQLRAARSSNLTLVALELLTRECRSEEFLESEDFVLNRLQAEHSPDGGVFGLPFSARKHVQRIGQYYAGLGMISVFHAVDDSLLLGAVHWRVRVAWSILQPYVMAERALRKNRYLSYFEHLACMAGDVDKGDLLAKQRLRKAW